MKKNAFMEMIAKKKEAAADKDAPAKKSAKPFAKGGACKTEAKKAVKTHESKMHKMAKGGGVEVRGKTKGTMVKMCSGGMSKGKK